MGKKKGRPVKENSKKERCFIRLSEDDIKMLNFVAATTGKSKSEIFRDGLRTTYNLERCKLFTD